MELDLATFVSDFAAGLAAADAIRPQASNQRTGSLFQPGIGPHTEEQTVQRVMEQLNQLHPPRYDSRWKTGLPYATIGSRKKCDLCLGNPPNWDWAIEVKMLRFLGDNGMPNDNILMHILSPYPAHRSSLTDCEKLLDSGIQGRKAILIYGYDSDDWPLEPAITAFEVLARSRVCLGPCASKPFFNLVHPYHRSGQVFAWEITGAL